MTWKTTILMFLLAPAAFATAPDCNHLLDGTIVDHVNAAIAHVESTHQRHPPPAFVDLRKEAKFERWPERGPKAFDALLPTDTGYLATPDPNTEHPVVAGRMDAMGAGALRMIVPFKGERTTTYLYYNSPNLVDRPVGSPFLINPPEKVVIWHMHGGGTPSAVAMNGSSKANALAKHRISMVGVTQPGHGDATRRPLVGLEELIAWNLAAINQLVHPDVKVIISGHSWGGQIALAMHLRSARPEYARVVGFFIESPPIDATLGGSADARLKFDAGLQETLVRRALGKEEDPEGYIARSCPDDVKFQANCVLNGKTNPVGSWFTLMSELDYAMTIPTPQQRAEMKPACMVMGLNDSLCFIGREHSGVEYAETVFGKENVFWLGAGQTFRGKTTQTGHQIFDNELFLPDGTKVFESYHRLVEFAKRVGDDQIELKPSNVARHRGQADPDARTTIFEAFLLYQNNLAFRSYLNNGESFSRLESSPAKSAELLMLKARRAELEKAILNYEELVAKGSETNRLKALAEFVRLMHLQYGVLPKTVYGKDVLRGGFRSAQDELQLTLSPARKDELTRYSELTRHVIENFRVAETAKAFELQMIKALDAVRIPKGVEAKDVVLLARRSFWLQQPPSDQGTLRTVWPALNMGDADATEAFKSDLNDRQRRKKSLPKDEQNLMTAAASLELAYKELWRVYKTKHSDEVNEALKDVPRPAGITEPRLANWELRLYSMTPEQLAERNAKLREFVMVFEEKLAAEERRLQHEHELALSHFQWPEGSHVRSLEQARSHVATVDDIQADVYDPPGANDEVRAMTQELRQLVGERAKAEQAEDAAFAELTALLSRRQALVAEIGRLISLDESLTEAPMAKFVGRSVEQAEREFWSALDWMQDSEKKLADLKSAFLLQLHAKNAITPTAILTATKEIDTAQTVFASARDEFLRSRANLRRHRLGATLNGQAIMTASDTPSRAAENALAELVGASLVFKGTVATLDPESLEARIAAATERADFLMSERVKIVNRIQRLQASVSSQTSAESRYFTTVTYRWSEIFAKDWAELEAWFNEPEQGPVRLRAFKQFLKEFDREWIRVVKTRHNMAKMPWYTVQNKGHGVVEMTVK